MKQDLERRSTDRGMQIDLSEQREKHDSSMTRIFVSASNMNNSMLAFENHSRPRVSIERGMKIDFNEQL
jgi:hypothetical protein